MTLSIAPPLLVGLLGCQGLGVGPDDQAIEITGYLDVERISWTYHDDQAQAAGVEGATAAEATVVLTNLGTETRAETTASILGTFALSVPAQAGDHLELRVVEAPDEEVVEHDVVADRPAFPDPVAAHATVDPHYDAAVIVELAFDPPLEGGHVWAVNPSTDVGPTVLRAFDQGAIHGGEVRGVLGDVLRLHWVPLDGPESLPYELEVRAPSDG